MLRRHDPDGTRRPVLQKMAWITGPLGLTGRPADEPGADTVQHPAFAGHAASFPAGTFLGELGFAYGAELAELGRACSFASGAVVFREGEAAGHIILIIEGHARVAVKSGGATRVIATRGPGDVIGERAASLEPVRSATAVATDELRGIEVDAGIFSEFLRRNPRAMAVLEAQLYGRMTVPGSHLGLSGQNCTVLLIDIARFSDADRTDRDRLAMIKACYDMLEDAFTDAGVDWDACHSEDRGDGALIIIPGHVPTGDVVHGLIHRLAEHLRAYNHRVITCRRFSLRAAVDVGPVTAHKHGVNGETIISAARLVEAARLKSAVAEPDVVIGIVTSAFVFERVARHLPGADRYEEVRFQVKNWRASAWMRVYRS